MGKPTRVSLNLMGCPIHSLKQKCFVNYYTVSLEIINNDNYLWFERKLNFYENRVGVY